MRKNVLSIIVIALLNLNSCKYQQVEVTADNYINLTEVKDKDIINYYGYGVNDVGGVAWSNLRYLLPKKGKQIISPRFYYEFNSRNSNDGLVEYFEVFDKDRCVSFTVNLEDRIPVRVFYGYVNYECAKFQPGITNINYHNYSSPMLYDTIEKLQKDGFILKKSKFKEGKDILIKDDSENYFKIVEIFRNDYDTKMINGLAFKLYSKNKFN